MNMNDIEEDCEKEQPVEDAVAFEFWKKTLKGARLVVAPMVDASELAWRMLSRRYGAELCYTPMLHSHVFVKDARYRRDNLASCSEDRPLIAQFCANDVGIFIEACRLAAPFCDAIDLNLGCPQAIARKGRYGAFLMEEWDLIHKMILRCTSEVKIPITAKIRVFPDVEKTVRYALMLQEAGVSLLTVHGRTREQKGAMTGVASWKHIRAVCQAVRIPVLANGNIQYLSDVDVCIKATGAQGVMSAEGNLHNPSIFTGDAPPVWKMALEYLDLVKEYPCPLSYSRGHIFKLMHHCFTLPEGFDLRFKMSKASSVEEMIRVTKEIEEHFSGYYVGSQKWTPPPDLYHVSLLYPPWLCQPYVRIPAEEHLQKLAIGQKKALSNGLDSSKQIQKENLGSEKRSLSYEEERLSKKKLKKLQRNPNRVFLNQKESYEKCSCKNPRGSKCQYELCRSCCKTKCYKEVLDCTGHRILVKTKRERAIQKLSTAEEPSQQYTEIANRDSNIVSYKDKFSL